MNIWCVGRNYIDHAKELGNEVPTEPLFFLKAGSCAVYSKMITFPTWSEEIHHELEIAFQYGPERTFEKVALALDLTERKKQSLLKNKGQPWTLAKSFIGACPLSEARSLKEIPSHEDFLSWTFKLEVNGQLRQEGRLADAVFKPESLSKYAQIHFPVQPGDWLLTGTPSGVGPLQKGDRLKASWGSFLKAEWEIS